MQAYMTVNAYVPMLAFIHEHVSMHAFWHSWVGNT